MWQPAFDETIARAERVVGQWAEGHAPGAWARRQPDPCFGRRLTRGQRSSTAGELVRATIVHMPGGMSANLVYCSRKASRVIPVGPFRCLATITSAVPRSSESVL